MVPIAPGNITLKQDYKCPHLGFDSFESKVLKIIMCLLSPINYCEGSNNFRMSNKSKVTILLCKSDYNLKC